MSGMRLRGWRAALAGGLLCAVAASAPVLDEKPSADRPSPKANPSENQLTVDQLIDALGSPDYDERQQATEILKAQKTSFTKELKRICPTIQDLEVRLRLVEVAEFLFYKEALKGAGGFLGIEMDRARPSNRGADPDRICGVRVRRVIDGSAADKGDIRAGDVVVAIDGRPLLNNADSSLDVRLTVRQLMEALMTAISAVQPGADMTVTVLRDGDELTTKVTLILKPLSIVRQNIAAGRLGSDHLAALEAARQEFARWRAELGTTP